MLYLVLADARLASPMDRLQPLDPSTCLDNQGQITRNHFHRHGSVILQFALEMKVQRHHWVQKPAGTRVLLEHPGSDEEEQESTLILLVIVAYLCHYCEIQSFGVLGTVHGTIWR